MENEIYIFFIKYFIILIRIIKKILQMLFFQDPLKRVLDPKMTFQDESEWKHINQDWMR